jgi:hypothetical protein
MLTMLVQPDEAQSRASPGGNYLNIRNIQDRAWRTHRLVPQMLLIEGGSVSGAKVYSTNYQVWLN